MYMLCAYINMLYTLSALTPALSNSSLSASLISPFIKTSSSSADFFTSGSSWLQRDS